MSSYKIKQPGKKATFVDRKITPPGVQWTEFIDTTGETLFELRPYRADSPENGGHFDQTITTLRAAAMLAAKTLTKSHGHLLAKGQRFRAVMQESAEDRNVFRLAFHPIFGGKAEKAEATPKKKATSKKKAARTPIPESPTTVPTQPEPANE